MQKYILHFNVVVTIVILFISCSPNKSESQISVFEFAILDVGEGLAQVGVVNNNAVLWDIGSESEFTNWNSGFNEIGNPHISAIIISHAHEDHYGALNKIPAYLDFDGLIIVNTFTDTFFLRSQCGAWSDLIRFKVVKMGDTLDFLDGVNIECLWPPDTSNLNGDIRQEMLSDINRTSFCFKVVNGETSVLITSDIDSVTESELINMYGVNLASDIFVVPHHGSGGSFGLEFYGYVNSKYAVISCGEDNRYGHPASIVVSALKNIIPNVYDTRYDGSIIGVSNGEYWTCSAKKHNIIVE